MVDATGHIDEEHENDHPNIVSIRIRIPIPGNHHVFDDRAGSQLSLHGI